MTLGAPVAIGGHGGDLGGLLTHGDVLLAALHQLHLVVGRDHGALELVALVVVGLPGGPVKKIT